MQTKRLLSILCILLAYILLIRFIGLLETIQIISCLGLNYFIPTPIIFNIILSFKLFPTFVKQSIVTRTLYQNDQDFVPCEQILDQVQIGDAIEFDRSSFDFQPTNFYFSNVLRKFVHWGLYAAEDTIYHLVNDEDGWASITEDNLMEAAGPGGRCRINNLEKIAENMALTRGTSAEILKRAGLLMLQSSDNPKPYHEVRYNCEHFVTYCLFGESISIQGDHIYEFFVNKLTSEFLFLFPIYIGVYYILVWNQAFLKSAFYWVYYNCGLRNFIIMLLPYLERFGKFAEEHEYIYISGFVAIFGPPVFWWFGLFE